MGMSATAGGGAINSVVSALQAKVDEAVNGVTDGRAQEFYEFMRTERADSLRHAMQRLLSTGEVDDFAASARLFHHQNPVSIDTEDILASHHENGIAAYRGPAGDVMLLIPGHEGPVRAEEAIKRKLVEFVD